MHQKNFNFSQKLMQKPPKCALSPRKKNPLLKSLITFPFFVSFSLQWYLQKSRLQYRIALIYVSSVVLYIFFGIRARLSSSLFCVPALLFISLYVCTYSHLYIFIFMSRGMFMLFSAHFQKFCTLENFKIVSFFA